MLARLKRFAGFFVKPAAGLLILSVVISLSCFAVQYRPVSADSSSDASGDLCNTVLLPPGSSSACGVEVSPRIGPSNLEVGLLTAIAAALAVSLVIFAGKRYFEGIPRKRANRALLYAALTGVVLYAIAFVLLPPGSLNSAVDDNSISEASGVMVALLAFVPAFAVFAFCLIRAIRHKQRKSSVGLALLVLVAAFFVYNALVLAITLHDNGG